MIFLPGGQSGARFDLLEPGYFITGNDRNEEGDTLSNNDQVRFRLAVRYRMGDWDEEFRWIPGDWQTNLYFAFTQDAFWNLYDESAPFYDNNFVPESYVYLRQASWPFGTSLGMKHQSNGREGDLSRGWNRYYASIAFGDPIKNAFFGTVTAWKRWGVAEENPDIKDFMGRGEITVYFAPGALWTPTLFYLDRFGFMLRAPIVGEKLFTSFEGTMMLRVQKERLFSPSIVIQYFDGAGPMLREYDRENSVWRIGLGFMR